jgi:hypothetical protein
MLRGVETLFIHVYLQIIALSGENTAEDGGLSHVLKRRGGLSYFSYAFHHWLGSLPKTILIIEVIDVYGRPTNS